MAIFRGVGGSGDATGDAANQAVLASEFAALAELAATGAEEAKIAAEAAQEAAETSETNAATSETNAASSASAASTSATNAATSASAAATSASNAATSASAASTSATAAATSASAAATSATNAATSESNAAASETAAAASETAAATSETNAAASEAAAATSETNAATSETNAAASASAAATSATNAATSATNASNSATAAATSETNAAASETAAATSETNAANSASAAATSATNAATSETNAAASASAALTSENNAAASFDSFDDRYLGAKSSDPALDNDGDALLTGALYWNTTDGEMRVYTGSAWIAVQDSTIPQVISVDSTSDALRITQVGTGNALRVEDSANPDATPFVVNADGRALTFGNQIGYVQTSALAPYATSIATNGLINWSGNSSSAQLALGQQVTSATPPIAAFYKARGGLTDTPTIVSSGDATGSLRIHGYDGTNFIESARIESYVDGTPGTNDMPGRWVFSTTADGESSPTERMRINSDGNVGIGTGFPGDYRLNVINTGSSRGALHVQSVGNDCWGIEIATNNAPDESDLVFNSNAVVGSQASLSFVAESTGYVRFMTGGTSHKTGTAGATEIARFTPDGLTFNGDTSADNALNDYEEGTWTPTTAGDATGVISNASGFYRKIGSLVVCSFSFTVNTAFTGDMVGGLPFTPFDIGPNNNGVFLQNAADRAFIVVNNTSTLQNWKISDGTTPAVTSTTRCTITYITT